MDAVIAEELRAAARIRAAARPLGPTVGNVDDLVLDDLRIRRYLPTSGAIEVAAVFAHGGYFLFGDLDTQDHYCRHLTEAVQGAVYSVDYRLAPENNVSASVDDLLRGVRVAQTAHPDTPLLLCGDSAGGSIAFLTASRLLETPYPSDALLLTNPNLDFTMSMFDRSAPLGPDPDLLATALSPWAAPDREAPGVNPMSTDVVGFPPTLIAVGALDSLAAEASAAWEKLHNAGVQSELLVLPGVGHGLMGGGDLPEARARDGTFEKLRHLLGDLAQQ